MRQYERALESYDRALAINPGFVQALLNKGNAHCEMEDLEPAIECYEQGH